MANEITITGEKCPDCGFVLIEDDELPTCHRCTSQDYQRMYHERMRKVEVLKGEVADLKAKCDAMERLIGAASYIEGEIDSREFVFELTKNEKWGQTIPYPDDVESESPVELFQAFTALESEQPTGEGVE